MTKKILDVPYHALQKEIMDCGIACAATVLAYDGKDIKYEDLQKEFNINRNGIIGVYLHEIGAYFLEQGYAVTMQCFNPHLFTKKQIGLSQMRLNDHVRWLDEKNYAQPEFRDKFGMGLQKLSAFMQAGGILTPRIPQAEDLRTEIDCGRPVIASVTNRFLSHGNPWHNMHFVTVIGYDETGFYIKDPWEGNSHGKTQKYDTADMMFAIHANAAGDLDNCSILKLTPQ